jgi:hypothetical protein
MPTLSVAKAKSRADFSMQDYVKKLIDITGISDVLEIARRIDVQELSDGDICQRDEYLVFAGAVSLTKVEHMHPESFLHNLDCVINNEERFTTLMPQGRVSPFHALRISRYMLQKTASGDIFFEEISKIGNPFDSFLFWQTITVLLMRQPRDKKGFLGEDVANMFLVWNKNKTKAFVVTLKRSSLDSSWVLEFYENSKDNWSSGSAVFFCKESSF